MMLVDIGANLTHQSFEHDYAEVLEKAQLDGVKHIIITGTDLVTSEAGASLASKHPTFLSSTVGIHPHNASKANPKQLTQLTQLIEHSKVVAIGETGLDYNRNYAPKKDQLEIFEHHLELAKHFNKPLFLHFQITASWKITEDSFAGCDSLGVAGHNIGEAPYRDDSPGSGCVV